VTPDIARQIALGNIDPITLVVLDDYEPSLQTGPAVPVPLLVLFLLLAHTKAVLFLQTPHKLEKFQENPQYSPPKKTNLIRSYFCVLLLSIFLCLLFVCLLVCLKPCSSLSAAPSTPGNQAAPVRKRTASAQKGELKEPNPDLICGEIASEYLPTTTTEKSPEEDHEIHENKRGKMTPENESYVLKVLQKPKREEGKLSPSEPLHSSNALLSGKLPKQANSRLPFTPGNHKSPYFEGSPSSFSPLSSTEDSPPDGISSRRSRSASIDSSGSLVESPDTFDGSGNSGSEMFRTAAQTGPLTRTGSVFPSFQSPSPGQRFVVPPTQRSSSSPMPLSPSTKEFAQKFECKRPPSTSLGPRKRTTIFPKPKQETVELQVLMMTTFHPPEWAC